MDVTDLMKNMLGNNNPMGSQSSVMLDIVQKLGQKQREQIVSSEAGLGIVKVEANLLGELIKVEFQAEALEQKPEVLAELVLGAVNNVLQKSRQAAGTSVVKAMQDMPTK